MSFNKLFEEGEYEGLLYLSDAQLMTEDGWSFDVHKIVLAKRNAYFRTLFRNVHKDNITIPGITGLTLDQVLYYIYTKTLPLLKENVFELYLASDYLQLDKLNSQIRKYCMDIASVDNCFEMYLTSLKMCDTQMLEISYRYLQTNFETLIYNDRIDFNEIPLEILKTILSDNNLCVAGEHIIWLSIVKWIMEDSSSRLCQLPVLLQCLKFGDIDESLANEIIHSDIIHKSTLIDSEHLQHPRRSLGILKYVFQDITDHSSTCIYDFQSHRHPKYLHIIADLNNAREGLNLYVTYDENVDIWHKLGETKGGANFLTVIGHKVYILDFCDNCNMIFDLYEKKWSEMKNSRIDHSRARCIAILGEKIFLIGAIESTGWKTNVEYYSTEKDTWFDAASMLPIYPSHQWYGYGTAAAAVSYQNKIFVISSSFGPLRYFMMAQVYDEELNNWSLFSPPNISRFNFAFVEYHGKLYVIGGLDKSGPSICFDIPTNKVEVFDFVSGSWELITDLPCLIKDPMAIVFDDQLIVFEWYGNLSKSSVFVWNEEERLWKLLDKSLPLKDFFSSLFYTIQNNVQISFLLKEIRNPGANFEKSCFG